MLRVALTGGLACGKSLCGRLFAERGAAVCDADEIVHDLFRSDGALRDAVAGAFGPEAIGVDGAVDRAALGRRVFADAAARERLNRLVHPAVLAALAAWTEVQARAGQAVAIAQIPLLYEIGEAARWDRVVCVAAPETAAVERLRARGLTEAEARARLAAQWPVAAKMVRADYAIYNAGSMELVAEQVARVWTKLRSEADDGPTQ